MKDADPPLTPQLLLQAYRVGVFPMSEGRNDPEIFWVDPKRRGIFPLDGFHISRSLARTIRRGQFTVSFDQAFRQVIMHCADRDETWINGTIVDLYDTLFHMGHAHSIEIWDGPAMVGGVYGVSIGGAYFGESMFSKATDTSKLALAYLIDRLRTTGYQLFDTQFLTPHLASLGAIEISRQVFQGKLATALHAHAVFNADGGQIPSAQDVIQRSAQTS